jgi:hypothetical protein
MGDKDKDKDTKDTKDTSKDDGQTIEIDPFGWMR